MATKKKTVVEEAEVVEAVATPKKRTRKVKAKSEKPVSLIRSKDEILKSVLGTTPATTSHTSVMIPKADMGQKAMTNMIISGNYNIEALSDSQKSEILKIGEKLDVHDINTVTNYGGELQRAMNDTSKQLLAHTQSSQIDKETRMIIDDMMKSVRKIDLSAIKPPTALERFMRKVPFLSKFVSTLEDYVANNQTIEEKVEKCEKNLQLVALEANKSNNILQTQFEECQKYISTIEKFIVAGKNKSNELEVAIAEMEVMPGDWTPIQIADMKDYKLELDKRLVNMKTWRTTFEQSLYRIREIQKANIALTNNAQDSFNNMMPILRQQLTESVALYKLEQGYTVVDTIQKGFNDVIAHNAEATHDAVVKISELTSRTTVDIKTLEHNQERLEATIRDAAKVAADGAARLIEQEEMLGQMTGRLQSLASGIDVNKLENTNSASSIEAKYLSD